MVKPYELTKEEKVIRHLCANTKGLLSFINWSKNIKPVLQSKNLGTAILPSSLRLVNESCLFHSAIMVRKFDDFFKQCGKRDDITSKVFAYPKKEIINKSDRNQINKCLAHFTEAYITKLDVDMSVVSKSIKFIIMELQVFFQHLIDTQTFSNNVAVLEIHLVNDEINKALIFIENQSY